MRWIIHVFLFLTISLITLYKSDRTVKYITTCGRFIELDRSPCYGYCPIYSVILFQDRNLYFIGDRFVPVVDTLYLRISKKEMSAIKNIMNSADYKNMVIDPQQDKIMDLPRILFTDHIRGQEFEMDIKIPEPIRSITHHINEILKNKALLYDDKDLQMHRKKGTISLKPNAKPEPSPGPAIGND